jgi:hypothetical protein
MTKQRIVLAAMAFAATVALAGCKNGNLFGGLRKEGTGDAPTLLADGKAALSRKQYHNAQTYFEAVLAKEPGNSEALWGAAAASMGVAGLDFGTLLSNVITTKASAPSPLTQALRAASTGGAGAPSADSILDALNLAGLRSQINKIICHLLKIRVGGTDGVIPRDDVPMLVSLTISRTLRAVLRTVDSGIIDVQTSGDDTDFEVEILDENKIKDVCAPGQTLEKALDDLAGAVESLQAAVLKVNPDSGSTLSEIRNDIQNAFNELKQDVKNISGLPQACTDLINSSKYDVNNLSAPTQDPGNCLSQGACCQ